MPNVLDVKLRQALAEVASAVANKLSYSAERILGCTSLLFLSPKQACQGLTGSCSTNRGGAQPACSMQNTISEATWQWWQEWKPNTSNILT